jgi:hypothetical protein
VHAGGAASTTGEINETPMVTGAQIGDSGTGIHLVTIDRRTDPQAFRPPDQAKNVTAGRTAHQLQGSALRK